MEGNISSTPSSAVRVLVGSTKIVPCSCQYWIRRTSGRGCYLFTIIKDEDSNVFVETALGKKVRREVRDEVAVYARAWAGTWREERRDDVFVGFHKGFCGGRPETRNAFAGTWNRALIGNFAEDGRVTHTSSSGLKRLVLFLYL